MIESIDFMCKVWGGQELQKRFDSNQGHSGRSAIARARDSQFDPTKPVPLLRQKRATALGKDTFLPHPVQFTEEGHLGEGLLIALALVGAPEGLRAIAFVHYAITGYNAKGKAARLGLSRPEYFRYLDKLHYWLAGRIFQPDVPLRSLNSAGTRNPANA